ncbi:hypothetical protein [Zhaonella formicivorans]|uniref:lysine 5,6-aminomutase reactivase subunit KamB n=1 Tax=Zhaonella formicivorans TaxID=2528593 RepID=UPI0010EFADB3|nr:hypothetical protein [Zhaonella formicivorans]
MFEPLEFSRGGSIAVIGMAKNTGKTVTLNFLLKILQQQGRRVGLTSIGLDGERYDVLTKLPKPSIIVHPGTLVATAERALENMECWEKLQHTEILTPLGEVLIVRAKAITSVVAAGPGTNRQLKVVLSLLAAWGAECILIDGAFDRQSSADPLICKQVILATGASYSTDLQQLISVTKCRVEQLQLPACQSFYRQIMRSNTSKLSFLVDAVLREVPVATTLLGKTEWLQLITQKAEVLLVKGAVGDGLGEALLCTNHPPAVIVQDGSKIFINCGLWRELKSKKIIFQVEQPINLLGVTVNPVLPGGKSLDPDELLAGMGKALYPLPVVDIMREVQYEQTN